MDRGKPGSVNGHVEAGEKMQYEGLDDLAAAMEYFRTHVGEVPSFWKADVDAAFWRIPVSPEHRWACGIAFRHGSQVGPRSVARVVCVFAC